MDYLVMIENAMSLHNLLSYPCLKVIMGGKTISKLQSTAQYFNLRQYDTIVLSFFVYFLESDKICLCGLV